MNRNLDELWAQARQQDWRDEQDRSEWFEAYAEELAARLDEVVTALNQDKAFPTIAAIVAPKQ